MVIEFPYTYLNYSNCFDKAHDVPTFKQAIKAPILKKSHVNLQTHSRSLLNGLKGRSIILEIRCSSEGLASVNCIFLVWQE